MTRVMRWHDFGSGREAGRSEYREYSQGSRQCHGPKFVPAPGWAEGPQTLLGGCSHNGRRAATWSRGLACGDATVQARTVPRCSGAPLSRFGVASNDEAVGTCSALRGTLCQATCSCAPASVSRSVVRDGAPGGVFRQWWYGASAASPANGPAANESQPPRYELHHPSRDQSVLAATHT